MNDPLPVHFLTIVVNGRPFVEHHLAVFTQLPFEWHWHVVEGVADLKHDTAWSKKLGGCISSEIHARGRSLDGTSEYLDEIARQFPNNVTVYRKPLDSLWDGKLEMVNAPLANIKSECLLWQVDADELWTVRQLTAARDMFMRDAAKTAALYLCHYFVGEQLVVTTRDTYGNNTGYEWIRTWRYTPGCRWVAHEPPRLCRPAADGTWTDLATINPFRHAETEAAGLVFQHFAYATESQLSFKEVYYGYAGAVKQWQHLQTVRQLPARLAEYFDWVKDGALVDTAESQGVVPMAQKDPVGGWKFSAVNDLAKAKIPRVNN